jgi:hypothetical protein
MAADTGKLQWVHTDSSKALHDVAAQAFTAAHAQTWTADKEGSRLWRAWLCSMLAVVANLGDTPLEKIPGEGPASYRVTVTPSSRLDARDWQNALVTGLLGVIAQQRFGPQQLALPAGQTYQIATVDGDPPVFKFAGLDQPSSPSSAPSGVDPSLLMQGLSILSTAGLDTGQIGIWEGFVVIACVGLLAGAVAWIESQQNEVEAIGIAQAGKTTQAMGAMTDAAELIERHQKLEAEKGASIPYSAAEMDLLQTLRATISTTTGWQPPPMASVPNVRQFSEDVGTGAGFGTFAVLALVGAALFLKESRRGAVAA